MRYVETYDYEASTDDVCNIRQTLEKLLVEYDMNCIASTASDFQEYAANVKSFYDAISALRSIEIRTAI